MERRTKVALVAVVAVVVVIAAAAIAMGGGRDGYSITYELNGGTQQGDNPDTYVPGDVLELIDPYMEGTYFDRWYQDEDLTVAFDGDTSGLSGDIVLYAGWTDTLAGKSMTLSVTGTVQDGPFNSYTYSGEITYMYVYEDPDTGEYLISYSYTYVYRFGFTAYSGSGGSTYWSDDSDVTWERLDDETIDTVYGERTCVVWVATYSDGSTETQWIGDGWIPYRIVYQSSGVLSSVTVEYTLTAHSTFDAQTSAEVEVYTDSGVTVEGSGTYTPGSSVTLTATVSEGTAFQGWYGSDGELLSSDLTYTIDRVLTDTVIYAANAESPDCTWEDGSSYLLLDGYDVDHATVTVYDANSGDAVAVLDEASGYYTFPEAGEYVVVIDGSAGGSAVTAYYQVLVDGTVSRTFEWEYGGTTYTYTMEIIYSDVAYYRDYYTVDERQQDILGNHARDATFVTYGDPYVLQLAAALADMSSDLGSVERVDFLMAFVQYIEYQADDVYTGYDEYWKFPLETLYDQGGDCEDTSILLAAIYKALGYDTCLLIFSGHMAAGVAVDGATGVYFTAAPYGPWVQQVRYYYCETTSTGFTVGVFPSGVDPRATVVVI